jgi:carbonic anhydrase/acetyltransferase-like protein (isoleucine patch superfamily)
VLDGAVVESNAVVAPGALVAPGKVVKSGQLWSGKPAVYLRDLTTVHEWAVAWL